MITQNFWKNRKGNSIKFIVVHRTEGTKESNLAWIANPKSQVSYHAIVDEMGEITTIVPDQYSAWHAGKIVKPTSEHAKSGTNPNLRSLGIGITGMSKETPTLQQILRVSQWIAEKCTIHNIPIDRKHIIEHNEIRGDKTCPGSQVDTQALVYLVKILAASKSEM